MVQNAQREFRRKQSLYEKGDVAASAFEAAELALKTASQSLRRERKTLTDCAK